MQLLICLIFIVGLGSCYTFDQYVVDFNKSYDSPEDRTTRESLFNVQMAYYQQFNSEGNRYTLGPTKWTDRTQDEIAAAVNLQQEFPNATTLAELRTTRSKESGSLGTEASPTAIDWRSTGVTPVKDQGSCGSCWAFAAAGGAESVIRIQNNTIYDLSEEYLLECTGSRDDCSGGYMSDVMPLLFRTGVPTESLYPYKGLNYGSYGKPYTLGICTTSSSNFKKLGGGVTLGTNYLNSKSEAMGWISQYPIVVTFYASTTFMGYKSGVFKCASIGGVYPVNHALVVVGYNSSGNYYIVKNSWGTSWGMNGYAYVDMDYDCGISTTIYNFQPPVTKSNSEWRHKVNYLALVLVALLVVIY